MLFTPQLLKYALDQKRNLHLPRSQIEELQLQKFRRLVKFAAQHSAYYKQIISKYHIDPAACRPEDFPVLTKNQVIEHFNDIVTNKQITKNSIEQFLQVSQDPNELFLGRYIVIHTSGSSGIIGYYIYTQPEFLTGLSPIGLVNTPRLLQKIAYVGAARGHFAGVTMAAAANNLWPLYRSLRLYDINAPFDQTIKQLNHYQPDIIAGYAFALRKLAEAQSTGELRIKPNLAQSGGEPLRSADQAYIQDIFDVPITNIYASSEHIIMGLGQDKLDGMYLMESNLIFELNPTEIHVTNLFNYTLPLIRYKMSDRLEEMPELTPHMPYTKIGEIVGRDETTLVLRNDEHHEDFISPHVLIEIFVKGLAQFQFHITGPQSFDFKARLEPNLTETQQQMAIDGIKAQLRAILAEKHMTQVTFNIELVDQLSADQETGKYKLIIHHTKQPA